MNIINLPTKLFLDVIDELILTIGVYKALQPRAFNSEYKLALDDFMRLLTKSELFNRTILRAVFETS